VSQIPTVAGAAHPYKIDARGLVADLLAVREAEPRAAFVFLGSVEPQRWWTAGDRAADAPAWGDLSRSAVVETSTDPAVVPRVNGPEVVTVYHGVADPFPSDTIAALLARLGPTCRVLPVYGFGVVRCD
jgi:hypothetical protein